MSLIQKVKDLATEALKNKQNEERSFYLWLISEGNKFLSDKNNLLYKKAKSKQEEYIPLMLTEEIFLESCKKVKVKLEESIKLSKGTKPMGYDLLLKLVPNVELISKEELTQFILKHKKESEELNKKFNMGVIMPLAIQEYKDKLDKKVLNELFKELT